MLDKEEEKYLYKKSYFVKNQIENIGDQFLTYDHRWRLSNFCNQTTLRGRDFKPSTNYEKPIFFIKGKYGRKKEKKYEPNSSRGGLVLILLKVYCTFYKG